MKKDLVVVHLQRSRWARHLSVRFPASTAFYAIAILRRLVAGLLAFFAALSFSL